MVGLRRFRGVSLFALLAMLVLVLAACGAPAAAPADAPAAEDAGAEEAAAEDAGGEEGEKVLNILYWQAPSIPHPYLSSGTKDLDVASLTLEPLAAITPEGELMPDLAVEIPTLENGGISEDLTTVTWTLKEGVKWSDGTDLTAEDVVFTGEYCIDPETGCVYSARFDGVTSIEAVDPLNVKITFDGPTPYPYLPFVSYYGGQISAESPIC